MRDFTLLTIFLALIPLTIFSPFAGLLTWGWVAFMHPHREVFTWAAGTPLNQYIAFVTLFIWLISSERKLPSANGVVLGFILFFIWTVLSTWNAFDYDLSYEQWNRFMPSFVFAILVSLMVNSKLRVHAFIWLIAMSLGYWGLKGGFFTLLRGGGNHVLGPAKTIIGDNNHFALAMILLLPLLHYLRLHSKLSYVRTGIFIAIPIVVLSIVGTYSRGAIVGLAGAALGFWLTSSSIQKLTSPIAIALLAIPALFIMPPEWFERIGTIQNYEQDASFMTRVDSWQTAIALANDRPLLGGGFTSAQLWQVYQQYNPTPLVGGARAAHSIYFQVLGDHGYGGLIIYLFIAYSGWRNIRKTLKLTRGNPEVGWIYDLTRMIFVSLCGFLVGGAALSMAYFDVYFILLILTFVLLRLAIETVEDEEIDELPAWRRQAVPMGQRLQHRQSKDR